MKSNLFLLIGEDKKLIDFNLYNILEKIKLDDNNKIIYDMNINNFMDVMEEASMSSMFLGEKVIIVNNFDIDKLSEYELDYLGKFIDSKVEDVFIILIANKVDARKKNYKLFKDNFTVMDMISNGNDVSGYIGDLVRNRGYKIDNINIEYLLSKVGNDINNINNELEKIFVYKCDDRVIKREDIDLLVFDNIDNVIYEFTNAIMDNEIDKIKVMYDKFKLENVGIDYLIATISSSFRISLIIKILNNKNMSYRDIAKVINKKEFFVKKSLDRLYRYTIDDLSDYINKLAKIDRDIKNGTFNVDYFELFLYSKDNLNI